MVERVFYLTDVDVRMGSNLHFVNSKEHCIIGTIY